MCEVVLPGWRSPQAIRCSDLRLQPCRVASIYRGRRFPIAKLFDQPSGGHGLA